MKPTDDMGKLIKKLQIKASPELDRKVHNDISRTMAGRIVGMNIWRITLAVAAGIIIAFGIGFFVGHRSQPAQPVTYSLDVNSYTSATSAYQGDEGSFWQQKVMAAMQRKPYSQNRFGKAGLLKTYKQYLKEKRYD